MQSIHDLVEGLLEKVVTGQTHGQRSDAAKELLNVVKASFTPNEQGETPIHEFATEANKMMAAAADVTAVIKRITYPCGAQAAGFSDLPTYCPVHGEVCRSEAAAVAAAK